MSSRRVVAANCLIVVLVLLAVLLITAIPTRASLSLNPHERILIIGDNSFLPANGVTSGTGTLSDPYMIQGWNITLTPGPVLEDHPGIEIRDTTAHFQITSVAFTSQPPGPYALQSGVRLVNVTNAVISGATFQAYGSSSDAGVEIINSTNISVNRNAFSHQGAVGLVITHSRKVNVTENSLVGSTVDVGNSNQVKVYRNNFWWSQGVDNDLIGTLWDGNYWTDFARQGLNPCSLSHYSCGAYSVTPSYGISVTYLSQNYYVYDMNPLARPVSQAPDNVPPFFPYWNGQLDKLSFYGITATQAVLIWPEATDNTAVAGYQIYMGDGANVDDFYCQNGALIASLPANTTQYTVTGLSPGTTYVFYVQATDPAGNQGCLPASSVTTTALWLQYLHDYSYAVVGGIFGVIGILIISEQIRERPPKRGNSLTPGLLQRRLLTRGPSMPFALCMIGATLSLVLGGYQFVSSYLNNGNPFTGIVTLAFGAVISITSSQMYLRPTDRVLWSLVVLAASVSVTVTVFVLPAGGGLSWTILTAPYSLLGGLLGLFWRARPVRNSRPVAPSWD